MNDASPTTPALQVVAGYHKGQRHDIPVSVWRHLKRLAYEMGQFHTRDSQNAAQGENAGNLAVVEGGKPL